ncbi:MAG: methyltransferase [Nanoarchaeota archaeon]|nr:methyltransferase [Nanoarchaeota archaeon]MBU1622406.1 methyltransferase [Nanoarchaeota archaeon]
MDIYEPREDSYLLQKYVQKYALGRVLDLGTGSGIQALTAAKNLKVKEVVAVDINEQAISELKIKIKLQKKIKPKLSDLFSNLNHKFDTIIFNPPYLPQDKGIEDPALYGGKHGYELSEKFFNQVSEFLTPAGKILFLFSSLTNQKKIDKIIENNLLNFKQLAKQHIHFEDLFVYLIEKSNLRKELEQKGITEINYLTHGKRGNIFVGKWNKNIVDKKLLTTNNIKVAIKTKRKESQAVERIKNEIKWLKILNKKQIGPKLLFYGENYFVYEFVEGTFILDYLEKENKEKIKKMLVNVLEQCFLLDKLKVNKEEMHRPLKHILVAKKPIMLDFERCHHTEKPQNLTQFIEFLVRYKFLQHKTVLPLLKEYKKNIKQKRILIVNFEKLIQNSL